MGAGGAPAPLRACTSRKNRGGMRGRRREERRRGGAGGGRRMSAPPVHESWIRHCQQSTRLLNPKFPHVYQQKPSVLYIRVVVYLTTGEYFKKQQERIVSRFCKPNSIENEETYCKLCGNKKLKVRGLLVSITQKVHKYRFTLHRMSMEHHLYFHLEL